MEILHANDLNELTPEQQELLNYLLQEEGVEQNIPLISPSQPRDFYPLSFAQKRIWLVNQLNPDSAAYNMCGALQLNGELDLQALEDAFNQIIQRHDILRACFAVQNSLPVLTIAPGLSIPWQFIASEDIRTILYEQSQTTFDLTRGPLLRAVLVKQAPKQHTLIFTIHHIIADAWSLHIIFQELNAYYQALTRNALVSLPALSIQYPDYIIWQQLALESSAYTTGVEYWKKQLQGAQDVLNLTTDGVRPAVQTHAGAQHSFELPSTLAGQIKTLSRDHQVSVFITLLTAFQVFLFRLTNQEDILIGTVCSNRNREELEHLAGIFSNTLVLRSNLSGNPSFAALLEDTKKTVLDAFTHQEIPFEKIVDALNLSRDLSRHPLFQVMFVYDELTIPYQLGNLEVQPLTIETVDAKFDFTLFVEETDQGFKARLEYNSDLFKKTTIEHYAKSLTALLQDVVNRPNQMISALKIVDQATEQRLLDWQDTSGSAKDECLHQLFEAWAHSTPNAIALRYQDKQISYQELNERSNQIAHGLLASGVQKNQPVALMLETGFDQIAALLAVCKVGGIYICLDQSYPVLRLKQILEELKPACFLSDTHNLTLHGQLLSESQREAEYQMKVVDMMSSATWFVASKTHNLNLPIAPTEPVYVVYTSGSTGKPKGILQAHGCSSQYMEWQSRLFQIHSGKRVGQWASITYDASYSEIFGALCFGATLCISNPSDRRDPRAIAEWLVREKINTIQLVPSFCSLVLHNFINLYPKGDKNLESLEYVMLAGERLPVELARAFQDYFNNTTRLYNLYGPSEIVLTSQYLIDELPQELTSIPIGHAFMGRHILILDKNHQLCPLGVPGEIYIRSPYLTLGYFKQPEETAKVYMQNPLHNDYPDRVYKTGDRARWLQHDEIEFLGRNDNQLKIRGSRVEIGEVEAVLSQHEAIKESVIAVKNAADGSPYLVAYVASSEPLTPQLLREYLTDYLPGYMIPAYFLIMLELPHTITGKVDRKLLATYQDVVETVADEHSQPASELELQIAAIWKETLQVLTVRNDTNFFDIGGHSLLMVHVQMKLQEQLKTNIPLVDLFKFPTIKSLANYLTKQISKSDPLRLGNQRALLRKRLTEKRK